MKKQYVKPWPLERAELIQRTEQHLRDEKVRADAAIAEANQVRQSAEQAHKMCEIVSKKQRPKNEQAACLECGKLFSIYRPQQLFCCNICRGRHRNKERRIAFEAYRKANEIRWCRKNCE